MRTIYGCLPHPYLYLILIGGQILSLFEQTSAAIGGAFPTGLSLGRWGLLLIKITKHTFGQNDEKAERFVCGETNRV